jgi:hypothetical protein
MRALGVVAHEIDVEVFLHLLQRLVPLRPTLDSQVFLEQRAVEALDEAVALSGDRLESIDRIVETVQKKLDMKDS